MAKVLVTGANGFLGNWLSKRLLESGHEVFCLVRPSSDLSELEGLAVKYLHGDVTNLESIKSACQGMDTVFHLAGLVAYRAADRHKMEMVNVLGTANVVAGCIQAQVRKLVHLSSVVAIGAGFTKDQILNENSEYNIARLNMGYFETKRSAELIVKSAFEKGRLDVVILNPSTIYGPGDAKKGSRKNQLKVAQGKLKFYTSGGVSIISVTDAVDGIIAGWQKGKSGERYILSGENILIYDLFKMIAEIAGQKPPSILMPAPILHFAGALGDALTNFGIAFPISRENAWTATMYHWFDNTKAKKELGINPKPAKFALEQSVQWMKSNGLLGK